MKADEIRDLTSEELQQRLDDSAQEMLNLRMQKVAGQIENPLQIRGARRDMARIKTILNERRRTAE